MFTNGGRATAGSKFHGRARQRAASAGANDDVSAIFALFRRGTGPQRADNGYRQRFRR
jgi:hypothetical protein